jgi:hypothetical protein
LLNLVTNNFKIEKRVGTKRSPVLTQTLGRTSRIQNHQILPYLQPFHTFFLVVFSISRLKYPSLEELQELLNISNAFANKWNLKFNPKKSKILITGKKINKEENHQILPYFQPFHTFFLVVSSIFRLYHFSTTMQKGHLARFYQTPSNISSKLINCLLFADDVVLKSESAEELQELLNISNAFVNKWNLEFNPKKSKILITGKKINMVVYTFRKEAS